MNTLINQILSQLNLSGRSFNVFELQASNESLDQIDGSPYQSEIIYNQHLPYADKLDEEADALLANIKANLGRCVMLRDITPGSVYWSQMLNKYTQLYGLRFTKEEHIVLIKLMYELVTIPNLQPTLVEAFAKVLLSLLQKKQVLSPKDLELPWEPLFQLCNTIIDRKSKQVALHRYPLLTENILELLVKAVKIYFPPNATQEILGELRPKICPFDVAVTRAAIKLLQWFLPVQLAAEHHHLGHELWFHEFMKLWEVCHNDHNWEDELMKLLAKLASNNIGYIDWNPYISILFTRFVMSLNLPVKYKNVTCTNLHNMHDVNSIGEWIASVLGNHSNAQDYLDKFLNTIETYFHPANFGPWLPRLEELVVKIIHHVVLRLQKERYGEETWQLAIPESHKLTEANVDAFVTSILPVVMTGVFNDRCSQKFCTALQYLAMLRANLVIPNVLEKVYPSIGTDIEPHKLITAMYCMVSIARPLVQGSRAPNKDYAYPEGPVNVLPLLFSSLPGIDINDPSKCSATLVLIATYVTLVPFVNCSTLKVKPETDDERMVCEETSRFEDFVLQFMERVFVMIESSSMDFIRMENSSMDGEKSALESMVESSLAGAFISIMLQTSESIFVSAVNKFRSYISNTSLETKIAGQLVGVMCRVFAKVNGKLTLRCLVPYLSERILEALSDDGVTEEEQLDNQLMFALLLMQNMMDSQGDALLPHMDAILRILDKATRIKSREGHVQSCRMLKNVLNSLCSARATRLDKSLNDQEHAYWKDWGESVDVKADRLQWYVPGDKEHAAAENIFKRYFVPAVGSIKAIVDAKSLIPREELQQTLRVIHSVLEGCDTVLPVCSEAPLVSKAFESCVNTFEPVIGNKREIKMPDGSNVRQAAVRVMTDLQDLLLQSGEDDTKSLLFLILIWSNLSMNKSKILNMLSVRKRAFQWSKKLVEDKLTGDKGYLPEILLERVSVQHDTRREAFVHAFTPTTRDILLNLFKLSISHYSEVRRKAQSIFSLVLNEYHNAYEIVLPHMVEVLGRDTETHHESYKGALYLVIQSRGKAVLTRNDWHVLSSLLPALVLSKPSEKPSVIKRQDFIVKTLMKTFVTTNITLDVPDACVSVASELWSKGIEPSRAKPTQSEIQAGAKSWRESGEKNLQFYNSTLDKLIDAVVEKNLHWRHRQMAMNFMSLLVHPDHPLPTPVVRYFINALNHESIDERKSAWLMTAYILKKLKRKYKKITIEVPSSEKDIKPGRRADNAWLQYSYDRRPLTAEQWNEPCYVHKPHVGYYSWPKKLEIYASPLEQPSLDTTSRQLNEQEREVDRFFGDEQNIDKLVEYLTLEEKKGKDMFNTQRCSIFKGLFRNHGDAYLPSFLKHLSAKVQDKQDNVQRFAAELVAGLISGSKHWPFEMSQSMWRQLLPIVKQVLNNVTEETISDWNDCFTWVFLDRDPRKLHWLLECLVEESQQAQTEASFIECARLTILQSVVKPQAWRLSELLSRLLPRFEDRLLENPFDNVRNRLASVLVSIFDTDIKFRPEESDQYPEIDDFVDKVYPRLARLLSEDDKKSPTSIESTKLLSTVCRWIMESIRFSHFGALSSFYKLYPVISHVENDEKEEELSNTCKRCLSMLAQAFILPRHVPAALQAIDAVSKSPSWSARASCMQFLQVLLFHNMSTVLSNKQWIEDVRGMVLRLLQDERVEVRCCAAQMLTGMVHCTLLQDREALLEEFKRLAKTKLKSKKSASSSFDTSNAIRLRHAGVLGMCAFIQAHPYDVPKDIPPIFEHLNVHLSDPEPVPTTIRKTLNDFKRTHCDGWTGLQGLAQDLTEEQFTLLQDLTVPPLYYA